VAKVSAEKWKKAEALRKAGKSYRAISKELNIPSTTLSDRAKRDDWDSNKTEQLIIDAVRVEAEIRSLETEQARVVRLEVEKQLEGMQFYNTHARIVSKIALKSLQADMTPQNAKTTMATLKEGLVVEGLVPFYPAAANVSANANAQTVVMISQDDSAL